MKRWTFRHSPLFIHLICSAIRVSVTDYIQLRSLCSLLSPHLWPSCPAIKCVLQITPKFISTPFLIPTSVALQSAANQCTQFDHWLNPLVFAPNSDNPSHAIICVLLLQGMLADSDPVQCSREDTEQVSGHPEPATILGKWQIINLYPICFWIYGALNKLTIKLTVCVCLVSDAIYPAPWQQWHCLI